jgi:lactoylglutathione lyase
MGNERGVNELSERVKTCGVTVISNPRSTGDGYYEGASLDPEGNYIEITS